MRWASVNAFLDAIRNLGVARLAAAAGMTIGPSMAVALLTTFYGAILANLVSTPLASKLERNGVEEDMTNEMYVMAAASIARQENPRRLEMLLNTILPPENKIVYFQ
jgi:chemotaxis protein MotA